MYIRAVTRLFHFQHTDTELIESLVKVPPGYLLLGTDNLAEHIGWASQKSGWAGHIILHSSHTHIYTHMSCSVPLWCPWELSCCLGATASACCLAHCCMLSGCHVVFWSRRAGCLQMARQMELYFFFFAFDTTAGKRRPLLAPGPVCEFMLQTVKSFDKFLPVLARLRRPLTTAGGAHPQRAAATCRHPQININPLDGQL